MPVIEKESQENTIQTASVISSINNQDKENSMFKWLLAIFSIIVVSTGSVVFMRKGKESDEIEIID